MTYAFQPKGVCSRGMQVEIDDNGVIRDLQVVGGCSGNLQGLAALVRGMEAEEAIRRLRGIRCGYKDTSCPDQLAQGLQEILERDYVLDEETPEGEDEDEAEEESESE